MDIPPIGNKPGSDLSSSSPPEDQPQSVTAVVGLQCRSSESSPSTRHKALMSTGSDLLKGTRFDWLTNPENMSDEKWEAFEPLRDSKLKTARAWAIKEMAMTLWNYTSRAWAIKAWKRWLSWALRCRLEPVRKVAKMIKEHLWGIINAIVLKADNGRAEGMNGKIQRLKGRAYGYRNRERFKTAIYFHCGGLDLYPRGVNR